MIGSFFQSCGVFQRAETIKKGEMKYLTNSEGFEVEFKYCLNGLT